MGAPSGTLLTPNHFNITKQYNQFLAKQSSEFCLALAEKTVHAKIHNQLYILKRLAQNHENPHLENTCNEIKALKDKTATATRIATLLGYEGLASRFYFKALSTLLPADFQFTHRTKHPPRDYFNAMLSFGYTLLFNDLLTLAIQKGLHPFLGYYHQVRQNHPALISDLMEPLRPVLIDPLMMSLSTHKSIKSTDFSYTDKGCYLVSNGRRLCIESYHKRLKTTQTYADNNCTYESWLSTYLDDYYQCISTQKISYFNPLKIR